MRSRSPGAEPTGPFREEAEGCTADRLPRAGPLDDGVRTVRVAQPGIPAAAVVERVVADAAHSSDLDATGATRDDDAVVAAPRVDPDFLRFAGVEHALVLGFGGRSVGAERTDGQLQVAVRLPLRLHQLRPVRSVYVRALRQVAVEPRGNVHQRVSP